MLFAIFEKYDTLSKNMKNHVNRLVVVLSTFVYISLPLMLLYFSYKILLSEASKICYFFGKIGGNFFPNTMILAIAQILLIPVSVQIGRLYKISTIRAAFIMAIGWNILLFGIPLFFRVS